MLNLINIAVSWYDFVKGNSYTKSLMEYRLNICDTCEHKQQINSLGKFLVTTVNESASIFSCGICKCPLAAKTAGLENTCPLNKWGIAGTEFKN